MRQKKIIDTQFFVRDIWIVAAILAFLGIAIAIRIEDPLSQEIGLLTTWAIALPWGMLGFYVIIVRKELPRYRLPSIRGSWAVFQGALGLLLASALEIFVVFLLVKEMSNQ